jgi:hypothetical protein
MAPPYAGELPEYETGETKLTLPARRPRMFGPYPKHVILP